MASKMLPISEKEWADGVRLKIFEGKYRHEVETKMRTWLFRTKGVEKLRFKVVCKSPRKNRPNDKPIAKLYLAYKKATTQQK